MFWKSNPGMLYPLVPVNATELQKWIDEPLQKDPINAWRPIFNHPVWGGGNGYRTIGFDEYHCTNPDGDCVEIYPPTGSAWAQAILAGVPTTARDYDRSYEAIVLAIATNEGLGVNVPQEAAGSKGMSAWKSSRYAKELKDLTAKEAMDRACQTTQWATRPPCTSKEWDVKILDDPSNNKGTVNFSWVKGVESICRTDLVTTAQTPLPIQRYLTSTKIYNTSTIGRAVLAISLFGILIELGLIAGFFWYRESEVIKAAAFMPSLIILSGGICTLIAVIMRISFDGKLSWPQCFGTYWLFAIGFSSLLGSLALKSYRIDRIFRSKGRMVAIPNKMLITMIAAVVLGNVIWLLMYQFWIIDDSGQVSQMLPNSAFELVQTDCPKIHKAPTVLLYLYNAAIMVVAAVYAFRTRNVVSSFNESVFTAAAILLITVITIVIIPVLQLVEAAQINLLLIGLGTFLATVLSTLIFAVPKLLMAMGFLHAPSSRETTTVGNHSDIKSSYTTDKKTSATTAPNLQGSVRKSSPVKGSGGGGESSDRESRV
ncbi:hypothetical protein HK097_002879 [Rhizophlyctis rosea]|uniref:G-protein coupled receptors family 3 profile domain-containing protein n=1 Tax=Rhizophlyctis rosea TaxID=64517 RepID=A0AAD5SG68_9FUNG|nr:hypothetical protein HK097_002879 [Rhizophlyctis rosea]